MRKRKLFIGTTFHCADAIALRDHFL